MKKITAYITSYEDKDAVLSCIGALKNQTKKISSILIFDNSKTPLLSKKEIEEIDFDIEFHHSPFNAGISGGLEWALSKAKSIKADGLWVFDQDSVPEKSCLSKLVKFHDDKTTSQNLGILAPLARTQTSDIVKPIRWNGWKFKGFLPTTFYDDPSTPFQCSAPITSGSLFPIQLINALKPTPTDWIIDGIDLDMGLRSERLGFSNWIIPNASMIHRFAVPKKVKIFGINRDILSYSAFRYFHISRNHTTLEVAASNGFMKIFSVTYRLYFTSRLALKIILFEEPVKAQKLKALITGFIHGLTQKIGHNY